MGIRTLLAGAFVLALMLVAAPGALAKHDGGKTPIVTSNDPGDGGGAYPGFTGYCRITGGQFSFGDIYYWSGGRRDKCDGYFMHVEFWNGSSWVDSGSYYD